MPIFSRRGSYGRLGLVHSMLHLFEPLHQKTNNLGFRSGATQPDLYSHRSQLEAGNFGFKIRRHCTVCAAKTKALIHFAVTAKLVCAFVFASANC